MLGWLLNLGFAGGTAAPVATGEPGVAAAAVYQAGAIASATYTAGSMKSKVEQ